MKWTRLRSLLIVMICLCTAGVAQAAPITVSTGDLNHPPDYNVIYFAGLFEVYLGLITPSNSLPSSMLVKYGHWNDPTVIVAVSINGTLLGSILAHEGYIVPGPSYESFDVTGLLLNGQNKVSFDGAPAIYGDYVIGRVDLSYDDSGGTLPPMPEPASMILLGSGLAGAAVLRRRRNTR